MISTHETKPSEKSLIILEHLKKTVAETLERKRKLGSNSRFLLKGPISV